MNEDDRSLQDLMLESTEDLEAIVKQVIDSLLNRDKNQVQRGNETVSNLVKLFDAKQAELRKQLQRVPEFQARESLIRELSACVDQRDKIIHGVEINLKGAEAALSSVAFQANQKLKDVKEAEARPVNSEALVKLAHQISKSYSVAAPLFWQQGDPSRPFPTEPEFRMSLLAAPKTSGTALPQTIGMLRQQQQAVRTPPVASGRPMGASPMFNPQAMAQQQHGWSPRTGYGQTTGSPRGRGAAGPGSSQAGWQGRSSTDGVSPFAANKKTLQSPRMISPSVSISGVPQAARPAPPPVRNVEQMSSDGLSSSSSDEDSPK